MNGHWQKRIPTERGLYWAATQDGYLCPPKHVLLVDGEMHSSEYTHTGYEWEGWWWSEPVPEPPKPPKWE